MAELASGAVRSLLGVLRDEARLLGRVAGDLKFIQEEMESMNSFLQHLDRTTPPGDHDEQVRTWMKQVRDLAYACSNCIDLYLLRGDQAVYRATGPMGRYLWWVPWYLQKLYAQHRAAIQLRELKARAGDVGQRRLRYDVKIPEKSGGKPSLREATSSTSQAAGGGDEDIIPNDDEQTPWDEAMSAIAFAEPRILEECTQKLQNWLLHTEEIASRFSSEDRFPSIAIAAPDKEDGADVALEALAHPSVATKFELKLWINFPLFWLWPATPLHILEEILRELLPEPREDERAKTAELDMTIDVIVKKTKEHLCEVTEKSPRVVPLEPLDILCDTLQELLPEPVQSVGKDQIEEKINETAMKIKECLEEIGTTKSWIGLDHSEYVGILHELLPQPKENKPVKEATDKLADDQIAKNIKEILQELHSKPQEDKSAVKEDTVKLGEDHIEEKIKETTEHIIDNLLRRKLLPKPKEDMDKLDEDQMSHEKIEEIIENIERIMQNIKEHLLVKEITKKIRGHLKGKRTIIVLDGTSAGKWWETKRALNQLGCAPGSAVIVTTKHTQGSEEFCHPKREAIVYSLVHYYYRKVLVLTSRQNKDWDLHVLRAILQLCEHNEFCMKMFVHAMYVTPDKGKEEQEKLLDTLDFGGSLDTNAKKMFMFSYGDLPRDYKTCLLYLAIFPRGHKIRRSTLVGRWVADGLITKEDWPRSVHRAERCFDELVNRWLVYPGDIGAAGKVKSCIVHDILHEFITKIARKEHFVDTRMSHHLARHFSVLSDVRLRSSDSIPKFLRKLHASHQYPLVKVLDLEGCKYFEKNQNYLKNICNKMLLLKYLSLRDTDITKLPKEINNLHQLEVLDIRQTKVRARATKDVLLLKLKRLLAGPISTDTGTVRAEKSFSYIQIPSGIEKMTNMEVLSHVKASPAGHDLKDIGKLWQLRKLGVVIEDKTNHIGKLLQVISDLNECLQSLSVTLPRSEDAPSSVDFPKEIRERLRRPPKLLESLSISGITTSGQLLTLLAKGRGKITKLTLSCTNLNQDHLKDLGQLPKLQSFRLRHESYIDSNLTFKKEEFQNLKYFLVEGSNMTEISFEDGAAPNLEKIVLASTNMNSISFENGAAPELEKIVLSSTNIKSLRGVDSLPELEVELNGNRSPLSLFDNANGIAKVTLRHTLLKQGDLQILAKKPNMRCLMLLDKSCDESQLTFNKDEFPKLSLVVVECAGITNISFSDGATPKLEKIVWSFTSMESLSGINNLTKLKELEFNGENVPDQVVKDIEAHPNSPVLKHNEPQNEDQGTGSAGEAEDAACFPFF